MTDQIPVAYLCEFRWLKRDPIRHPNHEWGDWTTVEAPMPETLNQTAAFVAEHIEARVIADPLAIVRVRCVTDWGVKDMTPEVLARCATERALDDRDVPHWCADFLPQWAAE